MAVVLTPADSIEVADTVKSQKLQIPLGGTVELKAVEDPIDSVVVIQEMPKQGPDLEEGEPVNLLEDEGEIEKVSATDDRSEEATDLPSIVLPSDKPNIQLYTPSSMLQWGQFEAKFFQQLYTQTRFFDSNGLAVEQNARSTYYSGIFNFILGYSSRFNFGVDAWLQSVLIDAPTSSPFRLFAFESGPNSRTALTAIGPKLKFQPFAKQTGFTVQTALLLPIAKDPQGRSNGKPYLATENMLWWTQVFYTKMLAEKWQLFSEIDAYWSINRGVDANGSGSFSTPASVFLSFFPTRRITLYGMNQFWPSYGGKLLSSWWYQAGVGAKYRIADGFDLELMYGRFLAGRSAAGPANALNFGIRFVRW